MRIIKLLSVFFLISVLCVSCEKQTSENVVFYSKDQISNNLPVQVKDTEGNTVSVNSKTVISLLSSNFFEKNVQFLRQIDVPGMSFKIKNYNGLKSSLSNVKVFLDEIEITDELGADFLNPTNNDVVFDIENNNLLNTIASKLLQKKEVVISYYSDAVTQNQLDFNFEFSITARGTFVD